MTDIINRIDVAIEIGGKDLMDSHMVLLGDTGVIELTCLIIMMAHLALDSEETNLSIIRPGLLRLANKVAGRMHLGEENHGRWDALLAGEVLNTDGSINGREAMRAIYHELKRIGFEQRFFDGCNDNF